jgi:DNA polymerase-3 subunit gamma/tau
MTYLVLARKWRPRSFETLIGQDHVVRALTNALSSGRLHHAWLFTGTRGVGKTTLSRLLAKSLNCETGITAAPCGVCHACTEIDSGRFVDYVELDAASNRGVDEMTQLLEQAVYAPSVGRFKVYMIDEVHMLTGHAFNAMLKTLEEPPPHVKFILATTDPQKIPVTVLSRCLQFNLKLMTAEAIVSHLQYVLGQENIGFETPALRLIAQAAGGSMRDALSLADQAIAYSAGHLTTVVVQDMLGTVDQRHLLRLLHALSAGDGAQVMQVADELASRGLSYSGALGDLAVLLSRIAIEQRVPGALSKEDPLAGDIDQLVRTMQPDVVQLFYSVAVHSRQELSLAPDEYAGFVMACLRMLSLVPPAPASAPGGGSSNMRENVPDPEDSGENAPEEASQDTSEGAHEGGVAEASDDVPAWEDSRQSEPDDSGPEEPVDRDDATDIMPGDAVDVAVAATFSTERKKIAAPRLSDMTAAAWPALAATLPLSGLVAELAQQSEWLGSQGDRIKLRVAVQSLAESPGKSRLCTVLSEYFGMAVQLNVEYGATGEDTARAVEQAQRAESQKQAEQAVQADPFVQDLMNEFDARVVADSIRPVSGNAKLDKVA